MNASELEPYLATTAEMLAAEGMRDAHELLRAASVTVDETGYDNWNGGTTIWTIYLLVAPTEFARLGSKRKVIEDQIDKRLKPVLEQATGDWYGVTIAPKVEPRPDWRQQPAREVSDTVRRNIIDGLKLEGVRWYGRLNDIEFLGRLYDLKALPSHDSRFKDAAEDIGQHRFNNNDWDDDWVYDDSRFNVLQGPSSDFLRFLCEIVHPVVRPDRNDALTLVQHFNDQLKAEGWRLVEEEKIAGRPRFVAKRVHAAGERTVSRARTVADALNAAWMAKEIERLENAVDRDPALAIGTAKELVESCCKSILTKLHIQVSRSADLPELTKLLAKELKLVPEGVSDEAKGAETIRLILRSLSSLTHYLAELRGLYGSGHGRDGKHRGLEARHARLAVGAAVSFIDFVTATYQRRAVEGTKSVSN